MIKEHEMEGKTNVCNSEPGARSRRSSHLAMRVNDAYALRNKVGFLSMLDKLVCNQMGERCRCENSRELVSVLNA